MVKVGEYFGHRGTAGEFGIEVEVEFLNYCIDNVGDKWRVENDGSLRGASREYVLAQPLSVNNAKTAVESLYSLFEQNEARIRDSVRAGVHIHMNCQKMTIRELASVVTGYLLFELPLINFCGAGRQGNMFCLRSFDAEAWLERVINFFTSGEGAFLGSDDIRYSALNLLALRRYGSIEFRSLRTPTNPEVLNEWIDALVSLRDWCVKLNDPMEIVYAMSQDSYEKTFVNVFGEVLHKKVGMSNTDWDLSRRICTDQAQLFAGSMSEKVWKKVWKES